jgi:hypothetical protein
MRSQQELTMGPTQIAVLIVLGLAVYLCWNLLRGRTGGIRLYWVAAGVPLALLSAGVAQALSFAGAVEVLNLASIGFALAALPAGPELWQSQMAADLQRTRLFQPVRAEDLLTWSGCLKLVDRIGAQRAAMAYLAASALALAAAGLSFMLVQPGDAPVYGLLSLIPVGIFTITCTMWMYRSARRLVAGS